MYYCSLLLIFFFWGFSYYNIDGEVLNIGKLILKEVLGIFFDGMLFNVLDYILLLLLLIILLEYLNQQICLVVLVCVLNSEEIMFDNNLELLVCFLVYEYDICDVNLLGCGVQLLQFSYLCLWLLLEKVVMGVWIGLLLICIIGLNFDGWIDIDYDLILFIINYQVSLLMCIWLLWINDFI